MKHNYTETLKIRGLKQTHCRMDILDVLLHMHKPCTAEELLEQLKTKESSVHRATVYRDLYAFSKAGIVSELTFNGLASTYYELNSPGHHHHHFVCRTCHTIADVASTDIETDIVKFQKSLEKKGIQIDSHNLKFYGTCKNCLSKKKGGRV